MCTLCVGMCREGGWEGGKTLLRNLWDLYSYDASLDFFFFWGGGRGHKHINNMKNEY